MKVMNYTGLKPKQPTNQSNQAQSEAMHYMLAHQLTQYYQPKQVTSTICTALDTWYMHCKLAGTKIWQNIWHALEIVTLLEKVACLVVM